MCSGQLVNYAVSSGYGGCSVLTFSLRSFFRGLFSIMPGDLSHPPGTLKLSFGPLIFKLSAFVQRCPTVGSPQPSRQPSFFRGSENGEGEYLKHHQASSLSCFFYIWSASHSTVSHSQPSLLLPPGH